MRLLKGHRAGHAVYAVAFGPGGGRLASCSRDRTVRLWDLRTGKDEILAEESDYTTHLSYCPNREMLACGGNLVVPVWDVAGGYWQGLEGPGCVGYAFPQYSPDGRILATLYLQGGTYHIYRVFLRDAVTLQPLPSWPGDVDSEPVVAFSPDGQALATAFTGTGPFPHGDILGPHVLLRDTRTGTIRANLRGHGHRATRLVFSPDGSQLAASCGEFLWVWDTRTAETVYRHKIDRKHFQSVAFSPDGRLLAVARNDASVRLYDARAWRPLVAFDWKIGRVLDVAFAPDGMVMAAGGSSGKIMLWDVDV